MEKEDMISLPLDLQVDRSPERTALQGPLPELSFIAVGTPPPCLLPRACTCQLHFSSSRSPCPLGVDEPLAAPLFPNTPSRGSELHLSEFLPAYQARPPVT